MRSYCKALSHDIRWTIHESLVKHLADHSVLQFGHSLDDLRISDVSDGAGSRSTVTQVPSPV